MNLFIKILLLVLIVGLAGPFIMKRPDGRPWMDYQDFIPDTDQISHDASALINDTKVSVQSITDENAGKTKVYRWRDASGKWHLSDVPKNAQAQEVWIDPEANIIQSQAPVREPLAESEQDQENDSASQVPYPMTVSPDRVQQLIEDSKNVQTLMDQRSEALDSL